MDNQYGPWVSQINHRVCDLGWSEFLPVYSQIILKIKGQFNISYNGHTARDKADIMFEWLETETSGYVFIVASNVANDCYNVYFLDESDAVAFKVRWMG